jgi:peptidoglycan hydrolase-like protein with peptidoglycan-binding domain
LKLTPCHPASQSRDLGLRVKRVQFDCRSTKVDESSMGRLNASVPVATAVWLLLVTACAGDIDCVATDGSNVACDSGHLDSTQLFPSTRTLTERIAAMNVDLGLGSQGAEVVAVQEYLTKYGYFPNDALITEYPGWRPVVAGSPTPAVFDEMTEEAVRGFQLLSGITQTGIVDEATRELLRRGRCSIPDHLPVDPSEIDLSEKYQFTVSVLGVVTPNPFPRDQVLHYRVSNTDDGLNLADIKAALGTALGTWQNETSFAIQLVNQAPAEITVTFAALVTQGVVDGPGGTLASQSGTTANRGFIVDTAENWTLGTPTSGQHHLPSVILHEVGHNLGLDHSSRLPSVMQPSIPVGTARTTLENDDKVAIGVFYDQLVKVSHDPEAANDIGVGGSAVWTISKTPVGSNFTIQKLVGGSFAFTNNGTAVRISVAPNGRPWVVNSNGHIWRRTTLAHDVGTWEQIPAPNASGTNMGCAKDIGIGEKPGDPEGTVWALGCNPVAGGFRIFKRIGTSFQQTNNGAGVRIDASAVGGVPWVVASDNTIHYRTLNGAPSTEIAAPATWTQTTNGRGTDIGVNGVFYPWVVGPDSSVHVWNNQPTASNVTAADTWYAYPKPNLGAIAIDSDSEENAWIVAIDGSVWRATK